VPTDPPAVERRLATILIADVYGYSRMMGENEERTVQILRGHRAVFDEMLKAHRGRVFNTAGDAILAEFPSAVEAVRCATEIQAALRTRNEHLAEDARMWFRIGINLGDVVVQDGDLLGDGVNVAARIQTVAEPGGICISGSVYDQIQNKLTLSIRQLGERTFKNIARPVRTFAISDEQAKSTFARPRSRAPALMLVGGALVALVLAGGFWWYRDHAQKQAEAITQKEAKLAAELRAAQDALARAEAEKRKAAEEAAAQKEAKLASELRAAKEALAKATPAVKAAPVAAAAAAGVDRFDGLYAGRLCKVVRDGSFRCGGVVLTAQHGQLSAMAAARAVNKSRGTGTITADGKVTMSVEAVDLGGNTVKGTMNGSWANNTITLAGTWEDGTSGNATLMWAPERPSTALTTAGNRLKGQKATP
jgi:class 3 adenylate cyclase